MSFCLLTLFASSNVRSAETGPLVVTWLKAQTNFQTWSADFIQTRTLKSLTQPFTATGHVWFAEPDRFRWELGSPPRTIALRGAEAMLVIYPKLKRVERYPLTGNQAGQWRDALALLEAGFPRSPADLESRFRILSQTVSNGMCDLALQPKSAAARRLMPQITISFRTNDFSLCATELHWADGSTLRNDFNAAALNPVLPENVFAPEIPADFKVVEPMNQAK